jgi:hypothetical protein
MKTKTNTNPLKLHLACGEVYLDGYTNIDAVGELAQANPELVAEKITTVEHYFKKPYTKKIFGHSKRGRNIVDHHANVLDLSMYGDATVDEILAVNLIDHLRFQDLSNAVAEWGRVLNPQGKLIIDVGDTNFY